MKTKETREETSVLIYLQILESEEEKSFFAELYSRYKNDMYWAAYHLLRNEFDAEDAVHEAMMAVIKNLDKLDGVDNYRTRGYLVTAAESKAYDRLRVKKDEVSLYEDQISVIADHSIEEMLQKDSSGLFIAIASLNPRYREMITMRFALGYSTKEIASLMGLSLPAARKLLLRSKQALARRMEE